MEAPLELATLLELAELTDPAPVNAYPPPDGWKNTRLRESMHLGYVRVSTEDQARRDSPRTQVLALAGIRRGGPIRYPDVVLVECASGADPDRQGFFELLRSAPATVIVTRMDRLARSVPLTALLVSQLTDTGAALHVLSTPGVDIRFPTGRLMLWMLAAVADFERELISTRTSEGMMARGGKSHTGPTIRADIVNLRRRGFSWNEVTDQVNARHGRTLARSTVRFLYAQATRKEP